MPTDHFLINQFLQKFCLILSITHPLCHLLIKKTSNQTRLPKMILLAVLIN
nr:MAG TPA: hypothetical protein [Caudoviricetes sp.]